MASSTNSTKRMPTYFISHGGGPSFFVESPPGSPMYDISKGSETMKSLEDIAKSTPRPTAIVVVSAHWEGDKAVLVSGKDRYTSLYYDYGGFPGFTYQLQYQAPADTKLAADIVRRLKENGIDSELDKSRDWDHGVFVPLLVMYPSADIPVIEVSILESYDPATHVNIGKALAPLRDHGVLILGSGFSTHTFNAPPNQLTEFVRHVDNVVASYPAPEREKAMIEWTKFPYARSAHRQEDHFMPLHVVVGAAGTDKGTVQYSKPCMGGRGFFSNYGFGV